MQLSNGETIGLMSGPDTQFVASGALRVHSGQAIGVLGGAVAAGEGGLGVQLIAAKDAVDIQAQGDVLKVQARDEVTVVSALSFVDFAAAKSISLSTAGGANIPIDGGNITVQCPGKILVKAGKKSFKAAESLSYALPSMPTSQLRIKQMSFKLRLAETPGPNGHPLAFTPWKICYGRKPDGMGLIEENKLIATGETDEDGRLTLSQEQEQHLATAYVRAMEKTYLTLLNLRNWDRLGSRVVTEQIYVHSKLLLADDRLQY